MTPINESTIARAPLLARAAAALALVAASSSPAVAETADTSAGSWLDQVIVTGTRLSDEQAKMPSAISTVDEQAIQFRNPATLPDLLRTLPGVQLTQPGGGAGIASFYMRGCQPNYTLFLVDGIKVTDSNDSRGGSFDLSTVSPGEVERIEVIRGPQSAVYGADALCGVVNVITKSRSDTWNTTVAGEVGRTSYYNSAVELSGPVLEKGGLSLRAGTGDQGDTVTGATFGTSVVNGKLTLDRGTGWSFAIHGRHAEDHGTSYPDQSGGPEFAASPARDVRKSKETSFDLQGYLTPADAWTVHAIAGTYRHEVEYTSPGIDPYVPPRGEDSDLKRQYGALNAAVQLPASVRMSFGADYMHEEADLKGYLVVPTPFGPFPVPDGYLQTRNVVGAFGEVQYRGVDGLTLLGSVRRDDPRSVSAQVTSRLGGVYTPDAGVTSLRVNWGQGFKLPSLWALGNALVGNPALLPEKSRTTEIGIARLFLERRLKLDVAIFDNRFTDLIDFDNNLFQFVNRHEVTGQGGEVEVEYEASRTLRVKAEAAYVQIDPKDSGIPIRQRPKWRGTLEIQWAPVADWSLYATWLSVAPVFDTSFAAPAPPPLYLGGYSRLDLNAEWLATTRLTVVLAVDNVFDKRYEEAYGFLAAGVEPRLGVRYRF